MPVRLPWFERRWAFDFPVDLYPDIIERLRGTPARVEERVRGLSSKVLTRREREGTWAIQENVGHLLVLEELPMGRLDDYLAGKETLRAADLTNRKSHEAGHNDKPVAAILADFRAARGRLMERLEGLSDADFARVARHPRLNVPMRLVDMCLFQAEHDDYHLARISELIRLFGR